MIGIDCELRTVSKGPVVTDWLPDEVDRMNDRTVALTAVRHCAGMLADAVIAAEVAQAKFAVALQAAQQAGLSQEDVDAQIRRAKRERPERGKALDRLAIIGA